VSLEALALRTPGLAGADLANLLNEAAILAGRRGLAAIGDQELDDALERVVAGERLGAPGAWSLVAGWSQ
jgi:cell division protease FtsH